MFVAFCDVSFGSVPVVVCRSGSI